jgi:hypothetical protein
MSSPVSASRMPSPLQYDVQCIKRFFNLSGGRGNSKEEALGSVEPLLVAQNGICRAPGILV